MGVLRVRDERFTFPPSNASRNEGICNRPNTDHLTGRNSPYRLSQDGLRLYVGR